MARYNKFQACRYGFDAQLSDPVRQQQMPLKETLHDLLTVLTEDAQALGCAHWLDLLKISLETGASDANWLKDCHAVRGLSLIHI